MKIDKAGSLKNVNKQFLTFKTFKKVIFMSSDIKINFQNDFSNVSENSVSMVYYLSSTHMHCRFKAQTSIKISLIKSGDFAFHRSLFRELYLQKTTLMQKPVAYWPDT